MNELRSSPLSRWGALLVVGTLAVVSLVVLSISSIPLGVSGEWTWARHEWSTIDPLVVVFSLGLSLLYCVGVAWGERRIRSSGVAPLARLCLLALVWFAGVLCVTPSFQGIGRSPAILYYKRTEGYFWQGAFEVRGTREFLHGYRDSIATGNDPDRYLHLGTHPPGLTLIYRGMLSLFEQHSGLVSPVIATEPPSIREAFDSLRQFPTPAGRELAPAEEATLWSGVVLTLLATAATCWPVYLLSGRMMDPITAWRAAALWPLIPSLLVFFPKSDLLCPVIGTWSCWLWLDGWSRMRWGECVLAGVGFFLGLMVTLALAPVALLLALQTCLERWSRREDFRDRTLTQDSLAVGLAVVGLIIPLVGVSIWGRCNMVTIWVENLRNHALFYDHNSRSFLAWLAVNPFEAAFALGVPVALLVVVGASRTLRRSRTAPVLFSQTVAWSVVWGILWLSGKNMGEGARLWIFLAPWPLMTAASAVSPKVHVSAESSRISMDSEGVPGNREWFWFLMIQAIVTLWTVFRVDGFHLNDLLPR